jgi:hypothetical protein
MDGGLMESIIQQDKQHCFICGMSAGLEPLDCHHVYGNSNRSKSEQYGLKVYIHHSKCHVFGPQSVHQNAEVNKALKAMVQNIAMRHYGWTVEDFREIFGKSYI